MTASLFMDPNPATLHPSDTIRTAIEKIMRVRYRSIPVVDEDGLFLGVVTVNCMLYLILPKIATIQNKRHRLESMPFVTATLEDLRLRLKEYIDAPVSICTKEPVVVVHPDTPLVETLLTLYNNRVNLPVVDKESGRLAGMISYYDVGAKILEEGFWK